MALDVSEILYDDADTADGASPVPDGMPQTHATRGRGRPKGSRTRARPTGPAPRVTGARELAQLLAKLIGGASVLLAMVLDTQELAMTPVEANDIAKPAARILAKSSAAARLVALAGKSSDYVELTFAVVAYGLRIWPVIVLRQQQIELQRQAQKGRPYGVGLTPEDAGLRQANRTAGPAQPQQTAAPAGASADSDAARAAADAARFGGAGFADPDALAAGAYGDVAATIRAVTRD